jgi:hypothetical protein
MFTEAVNFIQARGLSDMLPVLKNIVVNISEAQGKVLHHNIHSTKFRRVYNLLMQLEGSEQANNFTLSHNAN